MKTYNELKTKQDKAVNDIIEKYQGIGKIGFFM